MRDSAGTGVVCDRGGPTVENCTIINNSERGIASYGAYPTIKNTLICQNSSPSYGAGVALYDESYPTFFNCTIADNDSASEGGGIACFDSSTPTFVNCIHWNNTPVPIYVNASTPVLAYCDVQGGYLGTGNIAEDPLFADATNGDYRLLPTSPCIDTGDPTYIPAPGETDIGGNWRLWDGDDNGEDRVDIGAYEAGSFAFGDLNCDGLLNGFDIDAFILALGAAPPNYAAYFAAYPDCSPWLADCNGDGQTNGFDIDPFVELIGG